MKAVVFYELGAVSMEKIKDVYPRHKLLVDSFAKEGKVIAIGTFSNISEGAMGIFKNKEYADEFIKKDHFVLDGIVGNITIKEWNEILLD